MLIKKATIYILILGTVLSILPFFTFAQNKNNQQARFKKLRKKMTQEQIKARGVEDKQVLDAMLTVPRHKFVPQDYIPHAYEDRPLPIGLGQTISQPYIVALMTELVALQENDKVLEVGTGSGYQAAVLAQIVDKVYTVEILEKLGKQARGRLKDLGYKNTQVKIADGYYGWEKHASYDAIIVTCAAEHVPPPLISQLKEGGKMCIPVGGFLTQNLLLIKKEEGKVVSKNILPVRFVPMLGEH